MVHIACVCVCVCHRKMTGDPELLLPCLECLASLSSGNIGVQSAIKSQVGNKCPILMSEKSQGALMLCTWTDQPFIYAHVNTVVCVIHNLLPPCFHCLPVPF